MENANIYWATGEILQKWLEFPCFILWMSDGVKAEQTEACLSFNNVLCTLKTELFCPSEIINEM